MGKVLQVRPAGDDHQVVSVQGESKAYRRKPCVTCPWRRSAVGEFPAEAFVHSASTSYDQATNMFACHESGVEKPATCAGFLLRGSDHNIGARIKRIQGQIGNDVTDDGADLFDSYRQMAIANGVEPNHPALAKCRDD